MTATSTTSLSTDYSSSPLPGINASPPRPSPDCNDDIAIIDNQHSQLPETLQGEHLGPQQLNPRSGQPFTTSRWRTLDSSNDNESQPELPIASDDDDSGGTGIEALLAQKRTGLHRRSLTDAINSRKESNVYRQRPTEKNGEP